MEVDSAIIIVAFVLGISMLVCATIVSAGLVSVARAIGRLAVTENKRNEIMLRTNERPKAHHPPAEIAGSDMWSHEGGLRGRVDPAAVRVSTGDTDPHGTPPVGRSVEQPQRRLPADLRFLEGRTAEEVARDPALNNVLWAHEKLWIGEQHRQLNWGVRQTLPVHDEIYPWHPCDDAGHTWHQAYQSYVREYGFEVLDLEAQYPWLPATSKPYQEYLEYLASQHHPGHAAP